MRHITMQLSVDPAREAWDVHVIERNPSGGAKHVYRLGPIGGLTLKFRSKPQ